MDPQQGKQAAQADARDTVGDIHLNEGFLPVCSRRSKYILMIQPKGPGYADHKGKKLRNQKVKTGKQAQLSQAPQQ